MLAVLECSAIIALDQLGMPRRNNMKEGTEAHQPAKAHNPLRHSTSSRIPATPRQSKAANNRRTPKKFQHASAGAPRGWR